ncbi:hypothetical protein TRIUR3_06016 [Triticum urartu]|uniref:Uncharacterized protein n=1 Tax=Triticum urartu TaxID=4572 RepID=M8AN07_TRIUA|nr:hypothetical protein TRIUR3_06016 [Triticum urartu]
MAMERSICQSVSLGRRLASGSGTMVQPRMTCRPNNDTSSSYTLIDRRVVLGYVLAPDPHVRPACGCDASRHGDSKHAASGGYKAWIDILLLKIKGAMVSSAQPNRAAVADEQAFVGTWKPWDVKNSWTWVRRSYSFI